MYAWSFAARTPEEVGRVVRSLGRHRYVREVDHRIHFTVDRALSEIPGFQEKATEFARGAAAGGFDLRSRDPRLWRSADADEVVEILGAFWSPGPQGKRVGDALRRAFDEVGLRFEDHEPFASSPEEPPHPELILLDWVLLAVDQLDAERHVGALTALELAQEEVDASAPIYQEACVLAGSELVGGAKHGVLGADFVVWSDEPYAYADYIFRGVSNAAKLVAPPVGYRDL